MANEIINIEMLKINNDKVKAWVENKIKDIGHLTIKKVDELPTEDIDPYCIYFVPKGRVCDEYMYIDGEWELLGSSDADLSNYYTKDETEELITAHNERETAHEDIRGLIDDTNTKIGEFGDLKTTAKSSVVSAINSVYNKQIKAISTGDNGEMVFEKNDDTTMEFPLIDTVMGNIPLGEANGIATLDANGKVPATQIPTSAVYIAGKIDAENNHTLPNEADYSDGAEIVVVSNGYVNQSTAFTLPKNTTLTDFEVVQANTLIGYGYVFSVSGGVSGHIGTVKEFQNDKLILSDDSEFNLPVNESLSAVSIPSTVQKPCVIGDIFMLIDGHWAYMNNTSSVSSVNGKTGAVTIAEYNPTNKPQLEKIGENAEGNLTYNGEEIKGGSDEFVGTKAEWEALSTEEKAQFDGKKVNITDDVGGGSSGKSVNYDVPTIPSVSSTTTANVNRGNEIKTNDTWGGKPIYQKTIAFNNSKTGSNISLPHGISNIGDFVTFDYGGCSIKRRSDNSLIPIGMLGAVDSLNYTVAVSFLNYSDSVMIQCGSNTQGAYGYITLRYTKTE